VRLVPLPDERLGEARALVGGSERSTELLDRALAGNREARAIVAIDRDETLCALVVFGEIAGTVGTGAILVIAVRPDVRRRGIGRALVRRAVDDLRTSAMRLIVAELAGSPQHAAAVKLLVACGFGEEGQVADVYRDGVPLLVLGHRLE
jgi:ribosomal protein S18 acetylase RimI-like enzyme